MIPINDIRGLEGMSYTKNEKLLRCKLAAAYRLVDMYGWTQSIYNHISVSFEDHLVKSNCNQIICITGAHKSRYRTLSH